MKKTKSTSRPKKTIKKSPSNDISTDLRMRAIFKKDYSIPAIGDMRSPYFETLINLYSVLPVKWDPVTKGEVSAADLWVKYKKYLEKFPSVEEYNKYRYELQNKIIQSIKKTKSYQSLVKDNMNKFYVDDKDYEKYNIDILCKEHYKDYLERELILVDLRKGNFQSTQFYDDSKTDLPSAELMLKGKKSYDDFMREFTDDEFIINNRQFRQEIFGNKELFGNPETSEKMKKLQKFIKFHELDKIKDDVNIISTKKPDEFIIEISTVKNKRNLKILDKLDFSRVRVEDFTLEEIIIANEVEKTKETKEQKPLLRRTNEYVPNNYNNSKEIKNHIFIELKNVDASIYPQLYKTIIYPIYYDEIPVVENDADRRTIIKSYYAIMEPLILSSKHSD